jgi:uncharacterized membrane protein
VVTVDRDPLDLAATPERLRSLVTSGVLPEEALPRALELAVESPAGAEWHRFVSAALLGLGSLLTLGGVIYFFAFNWAALHRFGKLGLIAGLMCGSAVAAWRLGERLAGRFALLFAAVLVGPLLGVYGQAYQTGADAYELFLGWALLIAPWVGLSRFRPLWLLVVALAYVGLGLYWTQALPWRGHDADAALAVALSALGAAAWIGDEIVAYRSTDAGSQPRWLARVFALMSITPALLVATALILTRSTPSSAFDVLALVLVLVFAVATFAFHRKMRSELFLLTLDAVAAMTLITAAATRMLFRGGGDWDLVGSFLVLGLLVIAELGAAIVWLRSEARLRGTEDV